MRFRVVAALLLVGSCVPWAAAQVPSGAEFGVNTFTTDAQRTAAVASDGSGNFVVVWDSLGQDGSSDGLFGQRFDASGTPRGAEFRVNTYTSSSQNSPTVASDRDGHFVVAWTSDELAGSYADVFAQRFDAAGTPRGAAFRVNTYTTSSQGGASVAMGAAGSFVVVWFSDGDGDSSGIFGQRFDAAGTRRGAEFQVNTYTSSWQASPAVASDGAGNFVVVWESFLQDGSNRGIFGQRFDAAGAPRGAEFQVNTYTTSRQEMPHVASDAAGDFVVVWSSLGQDGGSYGVFAQLYDASGVPRGAEFPVNTATAASQYFPSVAADGAGNFVVAWQSYGQDGSYESVFAQRYDASGAARGAEFLVTTYTTDNQSEPAVASDPAGNLVVVWDSYAQDGSSRGIFGQRFGGLTPAALSVDAAAGAGSDGNSVLEPGETVDVKPSWKNRNGVAQTFDATAPTLTGPEASGVSYSVPDAAGAYGLVANGATAQCSDCYVAAVGFAGARPAPHWDATLTERLTPEAQGQAKLWALHVGESFTDVPKTSGVYRFVETLLHRQVTGGCTATTYCPGSSATRGQMAVFALVGKEGSNYSPQPCGVAPMFADVPVTSPICKWAEELARRGIVGGCGGGNYCPGTAVTRGQMPIFMLKTLDPAFSPPACTTPLFADVPASSPYCAYIEELARRGVVSGCGGGNYCPASPVTRGQMAVFITSTFGLTLYGP